MAAIGGGGIWVTARSLERPEVRAVPFAREDGARAQQKIFDLARRPSRDGTVVLTEPEVNAFVAQHLDARDLPLSEPVIRLLGDDEVEIVGRLPVGRLIEESPAGPMAQWLPPSWRERRVWLTVLMHVRGEMEPRPSLRLEPRRVALGRQPLPPIALRVLLDPSSLRLTRITLPGDTRAVRVEAGRVIILTTAARGRT